MVHDETWISYLVHTKWIAERFKRSTANRLRHARKEDKHLILAFFSFFVSLSAPRFVDRIVGLRENISAFYDNCLVVCVLWGLWRQAFFSIYKILGSGFRDLGSLHIEPVGDLQLGFKRMIPPTSQGVSMILRIIRAGTHLLLDYGFLDYRSVVLWSLIWLVFLLGYHILAPKRGRFPTPRR